MAGVAVAVAAGAVKREGMKVMRKRTMRLRATTRHSALNTAIVPSRMQVTSVGVGCDSAVGLSKAMNEAADQNGCVVRDFVSTVSSGDGAMVWAEAFCKALRPKAFKMSVHEGIGARDGEAFAAQLRREVAARFDDLGGAGEKDATAAGVAAVCTVIEKMADVHRNAVSYKNKEGVMRFKAKIELNQDGACTKYHDDMVDVRLVTTLVGDGTVIADNSGVRWHAYEKTGGFLPDDVDESNYTEAVHTFNDCVVTGGELKLGPGDLGVMKGKKATRRPCIHRAPWTADVGTTHPRFLLTLERMGKKALRESHEMEQEMEQDFHSSEE